MNEQLDQRLKAMAFIAMLTDLAKRQEEEEEKEVEDYRPTLGERRMRISYNSPEDTDEYRVKVGAANLIDHLEARKNDFASETYDSMDAASFREYSNDFFREIALAQTEVEKSTCFVVKALTNEVLN